MDPLNNDPPQFLLSIFPRIAANGVVKGFGIQHTNKAVPPEIIITIVRMWLREFEDICYDKFKAA